MKVQPIFANSAFTEMLMKIDRNSIAKDINLICTKA